MSVDSAGISRALIKYSGKYVKIYFNMKITFSAPPVVPDSPPPPVAKGLLGV